MGTPRTHAGEREGALYRAPRDTSESAILDRIVQPDHPQLPPEVAQSVLALDFAEADKERMLELSAKAHEGTLTTEEQVEINNYERVGHFLNILQSKARRSLKSTGDDEKDKPD